ncbi:uncharacterized protein LOC128555339 [Mercenaria mercenaria]|uniref:uncharacterized protein LOC128555339 n=1 Tax=Mercenaria mercenaria TaxID=6596 RepID=UPI00234EFBC9|nr:uncharacterized protein LOC128555339 [Mercenaria mercenaria]
MESMLQKLIERDQMFQKGTHPSSCHSDTDFLSQRQQRHDSEVEDDTVSIHAPREQFSPREPRLSDAESDSDSHFSRHKDDSSNVNCSAALGENLTEAQKKDLYEMFGDDGLVKKSDKKEGLVLDSSQIDVLNSSYRCKEPNFLTSFSEENFDLFPVDSESEKLLQVPSLDSLIECCLTKKYGNKASFTKGTKGKTLFTQPAKMVEKIGYRGQQAARLGLVIQMYIQQSLGNLLQFLQSDKFSKDQATQQVKDIFAMSTKCLDQIGRAGAFHHIIRRSVAISDTSLYEQPNNLEFSNLPLTGDGVFGAELESLLKSRKDNKKQVEELIPDIKKKDY